MSRECIFPVLEHLLLQGFSQELEYRVLTEQKRRECAGDSMFLPTVASVLLAVFLNPMAPWWEETQPPRKRARRQ